jgi:hypothetical protein
MAENLYMVGTGFTAQLTTANPTAETTGTAGTASVLLQLATPATGQFCLVEYGVSLSGSPAAASLVLSGRPTTAATVVAGVIEQYSGGAALASRCVTGTSGTGYTTAQTAPTGTSTNVYDMQLLTTNTYIKQWPLAREPIVPVSTFVQVVINVPTTAVTAYAYIIWRE